MSGQDILIEQLREELEKAHAASEYQTRRIEHYRTQIDFCERRAEKAERERDEWKARHDTLADVSRKCIATAERERDEARANYAFMVERAADQKLDGYRELGARAAAAEERAEKAERERDALRHHYDEASPEHNLLALLDMYDERRVAAESERDEARAERDALHVALELAEVEVALDRSWCRICRTECRGAHRGRREHMHAAECVLNIRAHAAKAVNP